MSEELQKDMIRKGETLDDLCGGRIRVLQKKKGYRFSLDAVLLAHFIRLKKHDRPVELGAGSAVIALMLLQRFDCKKIVGVEIQNDLVDLARRSVRLNGLEGRVEILAGDVRTIQKMFSPQSARVVFFNPPYRKVRSGRINPDGEKALARHEIQGTLDDFMAAARYLLKDSGSLFVIYPAVRFVELMHRMRLNDLEPKRVRLVHSQRSSRGAFALVEGIRGGGEELEVLAPLFIYGEGGGYTDDMRRIFNEVRGPLPSCGE